MINSLCCKSGLVSGALRFLINNPLGNKCKYAVSVNKINKKKSRVGVCLPALHHSALIAHFIGGRIIHPEGTDRQKDALILIIIKVNRVKWLH